MSSEQSKSRAVTIEELVRTNRLWEEQYNRLAGDTEKVIMELKRQLRAVQLENERARQLEPDEGGHSTSSQRELETLRRRLATSESARRKAEEQTEALTSKMEFLERHCEEEATNRERACERVAKLEKELERLKLHVRNVSDERNELLAVREQADLFRQDFLSERDEKRRLVDENKRLKRRLENHVEGNQVSLSRELGFAVTDELLKLQADRWSEYRAGESGRKAIVARGADKCAMVECQGQ